MQFFSTIVKVKVAPVDFKLTYLDIIDSDIRLMVSIPDLYPINLYNRSKG